MPMDVFANLVHAPRSRTRGLSGARDSRLSRTGDTSVGATADPRDSLMASRVQRFGDVVSLARIRPLLFVLVVGCDQANDHVTNTDGPAEERIPTGFYVGDGGFLLDQVPQGTNGADAGATVVGAPDAG